jgi:hypothetical protein
MNQEKIYSLEELNQLKAAYAKAGAVNRSNQQGVQQSKVKQKPKSDLVSVLLNWLTQ